MNLSPNSNNQPVPLYKTANNAEPNTTVLDSSGYGRDGVASKNTSDFHTDEAKIGAGAFDFDGDDYITVQNANNLSIATQGGQGGSISVWAKSDEAGLEKATYLIGKVHEYRMVHNNTNTFYVYFKIGGDWINAHSAAFSDTGWHHIVATYDLSTIKIYIDGDEKGSNTYAGYVTPTANNLAIGKYTTDYYEGIIDDVMLFDRALSAEDVRVLANSPAGLDYDEAGNTTQDARGYTYEYDYENRITKIEKPGAVAEFAYDVLGRRIKKTDSVASETTIYYYNDNWQVLCEYDENGTFQQWFAYGNYIDEPVFKGKEDDETPESTDLYFYAHDHLYSTVALIQRASADVNERYEYDAYGNCQIMDGSYSPRATSNYDNPYLFTGRRLDILDAGSLKLQYSRNRYYDRYTGRWLTHDPMGYVDGMNLYEYVMSNPAKGLDPWGKWTECSAKAELRKQIEEWRSKEYIFALDLMTWFHDRKDADPYTPTQDNIDEVKIHGKSRILNVIYSSISPGHGLLGMPPMHGMHYVDYDHPGGEQSSNIRWIPGHDNRNNEDNMGYAYGGADLSFEGAIEVINTCAIEEAWDCWSWYGSVDIKLADKYVFNKTGVAYAKQVYTEIKSKSYAAAVWLENNCDYKPFKHEMTFSLTLDSIGGPVE